MQPVIEFMKNRCECWQSSILRVITSHVWPRISYIHPLWTVATEQNSVKDILHFKIKNSEEPLEFINRIVLKPFYIEQRLKTHSEQASHDGMKNHGSFSSGFIFCLSLHLFCDFGA